MEESSMGSSPHTRDKCVYEFLMTNKTRITPAYAGQMKFLVRRFLKQRDHPRIRGTNIKEPSARPSCKESSPHTRDKFQKIFCHKNNCGITPAYAGQIVDYLNQKGQGRDHPRIRGTNIYPMRKSRMKSGSPPHTRDKWVSGNTKEHKDRITPAYAGQMNFVIDEISIKGDHPRIRGTNYWSNLLTSQRIGSPPHTRDKYLKIP